MSFPVAQKASVCFVRAYCSASCWADEPVAPPRLRLITRAPLSAAHVMASAVPDDGQPYPNGNVGPHTFATSS